MDSRYYFKFLMVDMKLVINIVKQAIMLINMVINIILMDIVAISIIIKDIITMSIIIMDMLTMDIIIEGIIVIVHYNCMFNNFSFDLLVNMDLTLIL